MTREEIIKGYTNNQKKSTWIQLGSNVITSNTKLYNKGMVYQVKVDNAPLFDCLVFCREDHIGGLDWTQGNIIDSFSGEISFGNNIIDPNLIVVMSKADFDEADASAVPSDFVPFQETLKEESNDVIISDRDYHAIITCLGYPYISEEELEYSRKEICEYSISQALDCYYRYFPRRVKYTYPASTGITEVPMPTNCYDILGFQIIQSPGALDSNGNYTGEVTNTLLRYIDLLSVNGGGSGNLMGGYAGLTGNYYSMYPPQTSTGNIGSFTLGRSSQQAFINYSHRHYIDKILKTDENGNSQYYIRFYTNKVGSTVEIEFAEFDRNYNHVEQARKSEMLKLSQAYVMLLFGRLRSQAKPLTNNTVDYSNWVKEAQEQIKEVTDFWQQFVKKSNLVRGSL